MNLFQRAIRSCFRKPVKSLLLLLVVCMISLLFLSGMASRSANIVAKDSTRQAIGAGFLLEYNPESRSRRLEEASQKILERNPDGQGSYGRVHLKNVTVMGSENLMITTDHSFESLKSDDIEKIAAVEGIADYNITTVPTAVKQANFERVEDADADQTNDFQGVALIGNREMSMDANVLSGNVTILEGRMTTKDDTNVCVISRELAEKNQLEVGDQLQFHSVKAEEPVQEATIVGIYQVRERMEPYMSGDTYRSENVIFTDLHFPEKVEQDDPLYEKAYFKVANVDDYDTVKEAIRKTDINWQWYDLIDNNGNLDTMASNFNDLEKISNTLLLVVGGAGFVILFLIFIFWIKNRTNEIGILLSIGIAKGKIFLQILTEAALAGIFALALSFLIAPAVSHAAADALAGQQAGQAELQEEMDAGKVATDYQAPELTITNVETEITSAMLLADGLSVGTLIVLSTCAASVLIFRKNPKDILSEMS
ncbi:MAG TPA: ABC transporter permease [Candidatus Pullilachnospira intestinigallinarum]|nr:ABC transporter permease [Candidatus Pullilachnospira intestinigallinarum]